MMIDTHCHLTDKRFKDDLGGVVDEAKEKGVTQFIVPATDLKDSQKVVALTKKYSELFGLVGVYPGNAEKISDTEEMVERLRILLSKGKIAGIGEIGLDCYWNKRDIEKQKEVFKAQLELAIELDLPVVIHSRSSGDEIKAVFSEMDVLPRGQFHCFGESVEFLNYVLSKGFYVSFCGNITYSSANDLRELAKVVPLERLLLETDSPYLPPRELRGSRNTPANVKMTAEFLAELKGVSFEELELATTRNAKELFKF